MRAVLVLLLIGSGTLPLCAQEGSESPFYAGRPLVEVLQDLNHRGLRIVFSSSLVPSSLRVTTEPSGTPREILDQILRPHGLYARSGAQGLLIVARSPRRREEAAAPTPVRTARAPAATEQPATTDVSGKIEDGSAAPIRITEVTLVSTRNPIVDVQNATVSTNFTGAMLRDIPNQRDVFALLAQTPGITMPRPDVGGNTAGTQSTYRAYGMFGQSITTVDGVNITAGANDVGAYIDYGALSEANVAAAGNSADIPVAGAAVLRNNALFFQDRFQVTSKLTLNYGVRFDQYHSSYPEQRFGLDGDLGPFAVAMVTPAREVVTFNTLVPRAALIYDVFGDSKTALKASWGRFATNPAASIASLANPIDLVTRKYAWDTDYLTTNTAVAATRITPAYVATLQPIFGGAQATPPTVDPQLKDSYIDEYTIGAEQEIADDVRAHATFVRKQQKETFGRYDRLRTVSAYSPVLAFDPGPDGFFFSGDDRHITVWETHVPPDATDYYLTNKPIGDSYTTVEFGVTKRMSDRWQLTSGVDWTKRNLSSEFAEDPNTVFWNSQNTETTGWTFKASGSYLFKHGVLVSLSYNAMKGEPYGRLLTVTDRHVRLADPSRTAPLVQGNMMIFAEQVGTYYLPAINLINLRAQKEFTIKDTQRLQLMLNIFNLTNVETVTDVVETTGPFFRERRTNISGAVVRFGTRYTF